MKYCPKMDQECCGIGGQREGGRRLWSFKEAVGLGGWQAGQTSWEKGIKKLRGKEQEETCGRLSSGRKAEQQKEQNIFCISWWRRSSYVTFMVLVEGSGSQPATRSSEPIPSSLGVVPPLSTHTPELRNTLCFLGDQVGRLGSPLVKGEDQANLVSLFLPKNGTCSLKLPPPRSRGNSWLLPGQARILWTLSDWLRKSCFSICFTWPLGQGVVALTRPD